MSDRNVRFGADLHLLPNLERIKSNRDPGNDLATRKRPETQRPGAPLVDLDTLSDADNLVQALLLRFLTPQGDLAVLGHPNYGSRLHDLIGELNTETTRNRAKLFTLQALADEPRVAKVLSLRATTSRKNPTQIDIDVRLLAIDSDTPLNLVFPFFLEAV
jgi:phage baseplate assembly protein W